MKNGVKIFEIEDTHAEGMAMAGEKVHAGFPSPAQDYMESSIDLNTELVMNKPSTFLVRVQGDSMHDAGIDDGDLLVVDKSLDARDGDIVIAYVEGEFAVKRIEIASERVVLHAQNSSVQYPSIEINSESNFMMWGVVTFCIKKMRNTSRS